MGIPVLTYPKPVANMKRFVAYSILLVGVAKSLPQEAGTNIAKLLEDAGYTPICPEEDQGAETPRNFDQIKTLQMQRSSLLIQTNHNPVGMLWMQITQKKIVKKILQKHVTKSNLLLVLVIEICV